MGMLKRGKLHLASWDIISRPANLGLWYIKKPSLFQHFSKHEEHVEGTFWENVFGKCIKIIFIGWIRDHVKNIKNVSNFWSVFIKSYPWIGSG